MLLETWSKCWKNQKLNLYDPNNALITASLLSPGPAQVDSRSGRGTSFPPRAESRHGRCGRMRQPLLGRAGPRTQTVRNILEHRELLLKITTPAYLARGQPRAEQPLPMQISPQIIAGQCGCPARAPPYLTHAGDLICRLYLMRIWADLV